MRAHLIPRHGKHPKVMALESWLVKTCPVPISVGPTPEHNREVILVMYGAGTPEKTLLLKRHRAVGGRVICFDRGYFGRSSVVEHEHYRVAIDQLHVSPQHMEQTQDDPARLRKFEITLRDDFIASGPVVVAGLGPKSCAGLGLPDWDRRMLEAAQRRFPKRQIIYRPKKQAINRRLARVRWKWTDRVNPIEVVLRGASLAIVRHSNVAVDACIAGVPVECEDGAARWLYQSNSVQPPARRLSFLHRLAWWNWRIDEMASTWKFLMPQVAP